MCAKTECQGSSQATVFNSTPPHTHTKDDLIYKHFLLYMRELFITQEMFVCVGK